MADKAWPLGACIGAMTLMLGLPGCSDSGNVAPTAVVSATTTTTVPATTTTTTTLPDPATALPPPPPPPPPHVGIWLNPGTPSGQWPEQRKDSCIVADITPPLGVFKVLPPVTRIRWKIYNECSDTQLVRLDFKGPANPFRDCPGMPEIVAGKPFEVRSGRDGIVDVTCTLVPRACTQFAVDVNSFTVREPPRECANASDNQSGQIEIDPW